MGLDPSRLRLLWRRQAKNARNEVRSRCLNLPSRAGTVGGRAERRPTRFQTPHAGVHILKRRLCLPWVPRCRSIDLTDPAFPGIELPLAQPFSPGDIQLNDGNPIVELDGSSVDWGCNGDKVCSCSLMKLLAGWLADIHVDFQGVCCLQDRNLERSESGFYWKRRSCWRSTSFVHWRPEGQNGYNGGTSRLGAEGYAKTAMFFVELHVIQYL